MSGYAYDYSLTPARSGWRSVLTGFLTIVAVVAVSTISGAVVTLELIAPSPQRAAGNRAIDTQVTASVPQQTVSQQAAPTVAASKVASRVAAPRTVPSADVATPVQSQQAQAPVQPAAPASTTVAANTAPVSAAPAVSPPIAPGAAMAYAQATVADSELTFSKGYARRRATQQGAAAAKAGNARLADVGVAAGQVGRTNVKVAKIKPRIQAVVAQDPRLDPRRPDAAWSANRFDFDRHQALAFGDAARQQQQQRRGQSGPSGFFDRLF